MRVHLWPWLVANLVEPSGNAVSDTCAEFRVKYVGAIEKLQYEMSKTLQEPLDLINYIDEAQVRIFRRGRWDVSLLKE